MTSSEERNGRLLVGRAVVVDVGEPWDFKSSDGQNVLKGRIKEVHRGEGDLRDQRIVIEVTPFTAEGGAVVDRLTATRRYKDETGIIEQVAAGQTAPANLYYGDQVSPENLPEGVSPFLIGGVRLAD
ncbi:MAG: hypothetical protein AB1425_14415 [Actinomycetota bacterium]